MKKFLGLVITLTFVFTLLLPTVVHADTQYTSDLIPKMTSNSTPSGIITFSSQSSAQGWSAFNDSIGTNDCWQPQTYFSSSTPEWLAYEFNEAKTISKYTIVGAITYPSFSPKNWTFEAWDEGTNGWVVLDTRTNETNWTEQKREYMFENNTPYKKYRINVTEINGGSFLRITEMEMMAISVANPNSPTNLTAVPGNAQVSLSWDAVEGAASYNVKRSATPGGPYNNIIATVTDAIYTDNTAINGTTYYYVVTAGNSSGESGPSNEVSVTPFKPIVIPNPPTNLVAIADGVKIKLTWNAVDGADTYTVKRGTTPGGPYGDTISDSKPDTEVFDNSARPGVTYYYVVTATNTAGVSGSSNEASSTIASTEEVITVEAPKDTVKVGDEFTTDIVLHNAVNMCAEDFKVTYNPQLFEYLGYEEVTGLKVYKEVAATGEVRLIVASLGKQNAINGDKTMVKLKFKALKTGRDKIDVVRGRIANNGTIEKDILEENCGEKYITVEANKDVNRTGEFTLLDLGIDAWYYGDAVSDTDTTKYDTDVVINNQVDDNDLKAIVAEMLSNTNYAPNN